MPHKFMYKILSIPFHQYFSAEGETIEFVETEIANTGLLINDIKKLKRKL